MFPSSTLIRSFLYLLIMNYVIVNHAYQYRPDLLALDLYEDSALWWVFAQRNPNVIKDPIWDFRAGIKIFLPKITTLKTALGI